VQNWDVRNRVSKTKVIPLIPLLTIQIRHKAPYRQRVVGGDTLEWAEKYTNGSSIGVVDFTVIRDILAVQIR
jgi:hypothetical protein